MSGIDPDGGRAAQAASANSDPREEQADHARSQADDHGDHAGSHADHADRADAQPDHAEHGDSHADSADGLAWESWPLKDDFPRSLLLVLLIALFAAGSGVFMQGAGWGVLAALVLVGATARYFVRTRYALDRQGLRVSGWGGERARPWSAFRACYAHRDGIFLSPFARPSRLDPFRGIFLRYRQNRAVVEAYVRARLAEGGPAGLAGLAAAAGPAGPGASSAGAASQRSAGAAS